MSVNYFDTEIAEKVGVNAAVVYQNIYFWCEKNKANNKQIIDGKTWVYNSVSAFGKLFSYLTDRQIRTALDALEKAGLIETGVYNKRKGDKTKWYSCVALNDQKPLTNTSGPLTNMSEPLTNMSNDSFDSEVKPLPDNKPNQKPDSKPNKSAGAARLFDQEKNQPSNHGDQPKKPAKQSQDENVNYSPLCMTPEQVAELIRIRKKNAKSAATARFSQRMINGLAKELDLARRAGIADDSILDEMELRGWLSFKAEWIIKNHRTQQNKLQPHIEVTKSSLDNMEWEDDL